MSPSTLTVIAIAALVAVGYRLWRVMSLGAFRRALASRAAAVVVDRVPFGAITVAATYRGRAARAELSRARGQATVRVAMSPPNPHARALLHAPGTPEGLRRLVREAQATVWSDAVTAIVERVPASAAGAAHAVDAWDRLLRVASELEALAATDAPAASLPGSDAPTT